MGEPIDYVDVVRWAGETRLKPFWEKVALPQTPDGCMLWMACTTPKGYGIWGLRGYRSGQLKVLAHRLSYAALTGQCPISLQLDHLCRMRNCVSPQHLEPVTAWTNIHRSPACSATLNARKTHCIQGHEFTPENTYRRASGGRGCRQCRNAATRAYRCRKRGGVA